MVTSGRIVLSPFVQTRPMSWIREVFAAARMTPPDKHTILTADDLVLRIVRSPSPAGNVMIRRFIGHRSAAFCHGG